MTYIDYETCPACRWQFVYGGECNNPDCRTDTRAVITEATKGSDR